MFQARFQRSRLSVLSSLRLSIWKAVGNAYHDLYADSPEMFPYRFFPSTGGLLPCGATGNGDYIHWLTNGPPDDWRIVVHNFGDLTFSRYDANLVEFVMRTITREY